MLDPTIRVKRHSSAAIMRRSRCTVGNWRHICETEYSDRFVPGSSGQTLGCLFLQPRQLRLDIDSLDATTTNDLQIERLSCLEWWKSGAEVQQKEECIRRAAPFT